MSRKLYRFNRETGDLDDVTPLDPDNLGGHMYCSAAVYEVARETHGEIKYKNQRERVRHIAEQVWESGGFSSRALLKQAKNMHYFPKSAAQYIEMTGFEGRTTK